MATKLATLLAAKAPLVDGKIPEAILPPTVALIIPESVTITRDTSGNVTSIIKPSKTITITYDNGDVVSFTDNHYLWTINKTGNSITGVTVTNL